MLSLLNLIENQRVLKDCKHFSMKMTKFRQFDQNSSQRIYEN